MADQEFLASFAVDVDEAGVSRLQTVLEGNRDLADEVAAAFNAAAEAIREYEKAATGGDNPSGEANRDTGSGRPSARGLPGERGAGSTNEPDRSGWHYAGEYDRWMPDTDTALRNLAQLQLSGILTGENAPAMPTTARELVLQNMETMFLGQATPDLNNAVENLLSWQDTGLSPDMTAREGFSALEAAAQDLIREPMEQAREYMKQAIEAEDAGENGSEYLQMVDEVLRQAVQGVTDLIVKPGFINLDFSDVKTVMSNAGSAIMGIGVGEGDNRAEQAARAAIKSPLMSVPLEGAKGILFNVTTGDDVTLVEMQQAAEVIRATAAPTADVIWGHVIDEEMKDSIRITLIATGIPEVSIRQPAPGRQVVDKTKRQPTPVSVAPPTPGRVISTVYPRKREGTGIEESRLQSPGEENTDIFHGVPKMACDEPAYYRKRQREN